MTTIKLFEHPFAPVAPQIFTAPSIGEWLLDRYGDSPKVGVQIYRGEPSAETCISSDLRAILANDAESYTVLQTPGVETVVAAAVWVWQNLATIAAVYSIGSALLASSRGMPTNVNRTSASPNNNLGQRENQVRILQRIEDIYGTVRAVPSLMMPTYQKYINHKQVEYGYYCVGRGYYDIADVRDGDTLVSGITGASVAVYGPFTSPNSGDSPQLLIGDAIIDTIVTTRRSIEVDGITLKAQNQVQLVASGEYAFTSDPGGDIIVQAQKNPNFSAVAEPGDEITISMSPIVHVVTAAVGNELQIVAGVGPTPTVIRIVGGFTWEDTGPIQPGDVVTLAGFSTPGNNRSATVIGSTSPDELSLGGTGYTNESTTATATVTWSRDYSGTREVASVSDGQVVLTTNTWATSSTGVTAGVQLSGKQYFTDWVTIPTADRTEVWINVIALQGLFKDNGGKSETTVNFTIEIEQMDSSPLAPTGTVETVTGSLTGKISDERAVTIEHVTAWAGPCRVRMYRTTQFDYAFSGTVVDEIKWRDLYGVSPVDKDNFGALTTVHTVTPATVRATAVRTRQLRMLASRKLPVWTGVAFSGAFAADGSLASGSILATSRIVDILPAVVIDPVVGNRDIGEVDMEQIWAVQQQLDALHPEAGQFNYTFDNDAATLEETIAIIADAAFCKAYRQSGKIRLAFDRAQSASSAIFTHRNKQPKSETLTRTFINDSESDGVEFVYQDPSTEQPETIRLPADGSALKPRKFELPGIRSFAQAWLRANREYNMLRGRRLAIETGCLTDARMLLPNQRVDIVDNTRYKSFDGEVVAQSGLTLRLSQRVEFVPFATHSIVLMRRDGSVQSIACTAGADDREVVLASAPSEAIVTSFGENGVRTIYSFAADSARGSMAYLVQEIDPPQNGYVTIRAINYSSSYYTADTLPIPDSISIIN